MSAHHTVFAIQATFSAHPCLRLSILRSCERQPAYASDDIGVVDSVRVECSLKCRSGDNNILVVEDGKGRRRLKGS